MPVVTRATRPAKQASDIVLLTETEAIALKRATTTKSKHKTVARKENQPLISTDIIEISSDEDDEPVAPRNAASTSKLQERIKQLEKEKEAFRKERDAVKEKEAKRNDTAAEFEEGVTCEICAAKMWSPFILPDCGHTFCQQDLENWFATALRVHRNAYPQYNPNMAAQWHAYGVPPPNYTCPKCREKVRSKPVHNFALKTFVHLVAKQAGESSPKRVGSGPTGNVWSRFFP